MGIMEERLENVNMITYCFEKINGTSKNRMRLYNEGFKIPRW